MKVDGSHVALRRTGRVWMREGLRWPGKAIRECRIREHGGRWYASVRVEIEEVEYTGHCGQGVLGIDLGLKTFATIAYPDGTVEKVRAQEPLKRSLRSLRRSQRKLARLKLGSNNRARARRDVGWRHRRMANIDGKHPQGLPALGVSPHHGLCRGNPGGGCVPERWGRKTSDLAPGELLRQLEYKARWRGGTFLKVARDFPSTQLCHECGHRNGKLGLQVRQWRCPGCGMAHDRDVNAARNCCCPAITSLLLKSENVTRLVCGQLDLGQGLSLGPFLGAE